MVALSHGSPQQTQSRPKKLRSPANGPFQVIGNDVRTIVLDHDGKPERVSADRVAFAPPPLRVVPTADALAHPAAKLRTGPTYPVDKILVYRATAHDDILFRMKWSAYFTTALEPRSRVPKELVSRYSTRHRQQVRCRFP